MPRTGFVKPNIANRYTWCGSLGAVAERFNAFVSINGLWRHDDLFHVRALLEDAAFAMMQLTLHGGWSVGVTPRVASFAFDAPNYRYYTGFTPSDRITAVTSAISIATPQFRKFFASAGTNVGNVDSWGDLARAPVGLQRLARPSPQRAKQGAMAATA